MTQWLLLEDVRAFGGLRWAGTVLDDTKVDVQQIINDGYQVLNITATPLTPALQRIVAENLNRRLKGLSGLDLTNIFAAISLLEKDAPAPAEASAPTIVWRPGGVEGGYVYTSWASVYAAILENEGNVTVLCDGGISPNGMIVTAGEWECFGRVRFVSADIQHDQVFTIRFAGGTLLNPAEFTRMGVLKTLADGVPSIVNTTNGVLILRSFSTFWNGSTPDEPIIEFRCSSPQLALFEGSTIYTNRVTKTRGLINCNNPGGAFLYVIATDQVGGNFFDWSFEGTASDFLYVIGDASCNLPVQSYFGGTQLLIRSDKQSNLLPSYGARPTALEPGQHHFDPNVVPPRPIWWDGAQWVDAAGLPI